MTTTPTSFGMLRLWNTGDAENLAKYANNRKIWINLRDGFPFPYTIKHARGFLAMVAQQKPITFYAIATPEEVIGGIGPTIKLSNSPYAAN
jgi:ribosomal-protein-alanine N-acetyltransferase